MQVLKRECSCLWLVAASQNEACAGILSSVRSRPLISVHPTLRMHRILPWHFTTDQLYNRRDTAAVSDRPLLGEVQHRMFLTVLCCSAYKGAGAWPVPWNKVWRGWLSGQDSFLRQKWVHGSWAASLQLHVHPNYWSFGGGWMNSDTCTGGELMSVCVCA